MFNPNHSNMFHINMNDRYIVNVDVSEKTLTFPKTYRPLKTSWKSVLENDRDYIQDRIAIHFWDKTDDMKTKFWEISISPKPQESTSPEHLSFDFKVLREVDAEILAGGEIKLYA